MGWAEIVGLILRLTPYVTAGVEVVHQGSDQATKTQKVQELLAVAAAAVASPGILSVTNAQTATAIAGAAEQIIGAIKPPTPVPTVAQVPGSIPHP